MDITKLFCLMMSFIILLIVAKNKTNADGPIGFVRGLLQNNLVGAPNVHKQTEWDFDPEVSKKRRAQFYELHGYRGEKLIERLGLGVDGNAEYRLQEQQARDAGLLGGVIYDKNYDFNKLYQG